MFVMAFCFRKEGYFWLSSLNVFTHFENANLLLRWPSQSGVPGTFWFSYFSCLKLLDHSATVPRMSKFTVQSTGVELSGPTIVPLTKHHHAEV